MHATACFHDGIPYLGLQMKLLHGETDKIEHLCEAALKIGKP
jgi:hypothetical protein